MSSPLCKYCLSITITNDSLYRPHYSSASELKDSAGSGCSLCIILYDNLQHAPWPTLAGFGVDATRFHFYIENDPSTDRHTPTIFFVVEFLERDMHNALRNNGRRGMKEKFEVSVPILIVPATGQKSSEVDEVSAPNILTNAPAHAARLRSAPGHGTSSKESWDLASYWLDKCVETHPKCRSSTETWLLPTRLIDVGTSTFPTLRLFLSDRRAATERYVTLSHCWGSPKATSEKDYRLLPNTLKPMMEGIDASILPKTFIDAITITRQLGIRFLWIDSLCIIQGDDGDWTRESSIMGNIYQNGFCNIAATAAANGSGGCFQSRNPALAQPCRISLKKPLSKFGLKSGVYDLVPQLWEELATAPLLKRAWVVQERVLASRVLHFAKSQLFWECRELDACEIYPDGAPPSLIHSHPIKGNQFGFKNVQFKNLDPSLVRSEIQIAKTPWTLTVSPKLPSGVQIDHYYVWNKILTTFTKCSITYHTDRLIAIAATAKHLQVMMEDESLDGEYLAGLWTRYLPYHLLWAVNHRLAPRVEKKGGYVAPSWSWASTTKAIEPYIHIRPDISPSIQILSTSTVLKSQNHPLGQVTGGHIQLLGWLRKFRVTTPKPPVELFKSPTVSDAVEFDEIWPPSEQEVWFLPVVAFGPTWLKCEALGLLLQETSVQNQFKRIGRFRATDDVAGKLRKPGYRHMPNFDIMELDGGSNKRCWFGRTKNMDSGNSWKERVITII